MGAQNYVKVATLENKGRTYIQISRGTEWGVQMHAFYGSLPVDSVALTALEAEALIKELRDAIERTRRNNSPKFNLKVRQ